MLVTLLGILTLVSDVHVSKQFSVILVTLLGILTLVSEVHL